MPKKSLGQNFLINSGVLHKILSSAEISKDDVILEVGPGKGTLTEELAKKAGRVIVVEKDRRLIDFLKEKFIDYKNVEIIEGDVLMLDISNFNFHISSYKVVANIPYYITSHFLRMMLEDWPRLSLAVLMVQKEVAQRMMAKPPEMNPVRSKTPGASAGHARRAGRTSSGMNLLALSVQYYADVEKVMDVSRGSFRPMPKVESAVIRLNPKSEARNPKEAEMLFGIAKKCFAGKRKQLITTLPAAIEKSGEETRALLIKLNVDPMARPETLRLEDWLNLLKELQ